MSSSQCCQCCSPCISVENMCVTKLKFDDIIYWWRIEDFDFHEKIGKIIKSPAFSSVVNDKYYWHLWIFPNDYFESNKGASIGICLNLKFTNQPVFVKFTVEFLNQEMKLLKRMNSKICEYTPDRCNWGISKILKKNILSENKTLTMRCHLRFSERNNIPNNIAHQRKFECNLSKDLAPLFENPDFSDVTISVKNKDYSAHKCILAARSPVFAAMFKHDYQENRLNRVEIKDIDGNVIEEMLRYIYTGKCENLESLAQDLLAAADKYALDDLKIICSKKLGEGLSIENAANILLLADMYRVSGLEADVIKFIAGNSKEVFATDSWKSMVSNPQLIDQVWRVMGSPARTQSDEQAHDGCTFWRAGSLFHRIVKLLQFK